MQDLLKLLDPYSRRARVGPAIIGLIPLFSAAGILLPWDQFKVPQAVALFLISIFFFALESSARKVGKRLESQLFVKWGGKPSVLLMRVADPTIDNISKERYLTYLAEVTGQKIPNFVAEKSDPSVNDLFYESAGNWLRERSRDRNRFNLLFNENTSYGFWRNLLGMKKYALILNAVIFFGGLIGIFVPTLSGMWVHPDKRLILLAFGINFLQGCYFLFLVNDQAVHEAAVAYARQLILSCEIMIEAPPTSKSKSSSVSKSGKQKKK